MNIGQNLIDAAQQLHTATRALLTEYPLLERAYKLHAPCDDENNAECPLQQIATDSWALQWSVLFNQTEQISTQYRHPTEDCVLLGAQRKEVIQKLHSYFHYYATGGYSPRAALTDPEKRKHTQHKISPVTWNSFENCNDNTLQQIFETPARLTFKRLNDPSQTAHTLQDIIRSLRPLPFSSDINEALGAIEATLQPQLVETTAPNTQSQAPQETTSLAL